jgi:hypothetical protein
LAFPNRTRVRSNGERYVVPSTQCRQCLNVYHREYNRRHRTPQRQAKYNRRAQTKLRREVFGHYGMVCAACGEDDLDVLSIDHVHNDGAEHRRRIFGQPKNGGRCPSGHWLYWWLKRNGFPPGFQVLCQNCNVAKHKNGGRMPLRRYLKAVHDDFAD